MIITNGSIIKDGQGAEYKLDALLGSGGFGSVYRASRVNDGHIFAVKTLLPSFETPESYLSFQNEVNQSMMVSSDNVIKYYFAHDGSLYPDLPPYIIMEYANQGTLRDLIQHQKDTFFDEQTLISYFLQLAHGMKDLSLSLVHRDIKPENMLNCDGVLKISDFGLSKIAGESTRTLTFKGYGTAKYVAPEAWNNDKNTIQMDIYSMGIVFYELATLRYPYSIPSNSDPLSLRDVHLYQTAKNPATLNKSLPSNIVAVILKMLEKPTQKRFTNWDDIISALKTTPLPNDYITHYVSKALNMQNESDLQLRRAQAEKEKDQAERSEHIRLAYWQYKNAILSPIQEFVDRFNSQYPNNKGFSLVESEPKQHSYRFSTNISYPLRQKITINGEILFKENFSHQIRPDWVFEPDVYRTVNYLPECDGKKVILWCQVSDQNELGFNLLLLENKDEIYGDWFILESSSNGLSRTERPSPFGFSLSELPKEIVHLKALHIYTMNLTPFDEKKLLDFLASRI